MKYIPSPGCLSRPLAEVARFLLGSNSLSEDLLDNGNAANITFEVDVALQINPDIRLILSM